MSLAKDSGLKMSGDKSEIRVHHRVIQFIQEAGMLRLFEKNAVNNNNIIVNEQCL